MFDDVSSEVTCGRVMVVDDDPVAAGTLAVTLSAAGHDVIELPSGDAAIALLQRAEGGEEIGALPDVLFVDIEMPGADGYATCGRFKTCALTADVPVIFLSGHDELNDRLAAYDAGGDDFMSKPFSVEEVIKKADKAIRHRRRLLRHKMDHQEVFGMAMTAITNLGETGAALKFSSDALGCHSQPKLAELVIGAMASLGLSAHVQLRPPGAVITMTQKGPASPLEESVFDKIRDMGRIFSFKNRMVVNYDSVSLLVVNMPVADESLCGRIRDHAAMIAEATVRAVENIYVRDEAVRRTVELEGLAGMTRTAVEDLRRRYRDIQVAARVELESMTHSLEGMYYSLGLTESQEASVSETVRDAIERVIRFLEQGSTLDASFGRIVEKLDQSAQALQLSEQNEASEIELW